MPGVGHMYIFIFVTTSVLASCLFSFLWRKRLSGEDLIVKQARGQEAVCWTPGGDRAVVTTKRRWQVSSM